MPLQIIVNEPFFCEVYFGSGEFDKDTHDCTDTGMFVNYYVTNIRKDHDFITKQGSHSQARWGRSLEVLPPGNGYSDGYQQVD